MPNPRHILSDSPVAVPRSFSGHALEGSNISHMAYLDEAGISNPAEEPFVVVAGILLRANAAWIRLERHLDSLADKYVAPDLRQGFNFHAMEIFHGNKHFPREKWPKEDRWKILDELVAIPQKFNIPIVYGCVERKSLAEKYPDLSAADVAQNAQVIAFCICAFLIELCMRCKTEADDVAVIVMENNSETRNSIKGVQKFIRDPRNADLLVSANLGKFVLTRVVDTVHFAEKGQSSPLQVADVCAFSIKRHMMGTPENERFYKPLKPMLVGLPLNELPPGYPSFREIF